MSTSESTATDKRDVYARATDHIPAWSDLLSNAVTQPGVISEAYRRFHNYSIGNQLLAMFQCSARGITPGPIGTFMHWKELGRNVKKGEKAIQLCMPVSGKRTAELKDAETGETSAKEIGYTRFVYRNNWFVLAQTEGTEYVPESLPEWNEALALEVLEITKTQFDMLSGNVQGYAKDRQVAVSPLAAHPFKTLFHELGHVILGHTAELMADGDDQTPRDIRELEAECVAMLCCASLGLPGVEFSRGYIQSWFKGNEVPERSAQKIFSAADKILKAGRGMN
jgi:antirestriction protein ArdC